MTEIDGDCSDRFEPVRAAFEKNFDDDRPTVAYVMNRIGSALMGDSGGIHVALAAHTALLS